MRQPAGALYKSPWVNEILPLPIIYLLPTLIELVLSYFLANFGFSLASLKKKIGIFKINILLRSNNRY